jgi:UDP-GlcNAc:undecaprenyl-phosphate/decaprenyl-phosphate GlcNAc-1-phosphate transferase
MRTYALLLTLSFFVSVLITPRVRVLAHRFGWLDRPNSRKVHAVPTPRLGGVAIIVSFAIALLPLFFLHNLITEGLRQQWPQLENIGIALGAIFLLGVVDDLIGVPPYIKLLVETGCGLWVFLHGISIGPVTNPLGQSWMAGFLSLPMTLLWLVGITNAFNLVDGIDGLAAGVGLFGIFTLALISILAGNIALIALLAALAGATTGFLLFNFHPASIFLGDSGSLTLGFTLASLSVLWGEKSSLAVAVVGPIMIFGLPVLDTGLAITRRFFSGAPIFDSDSDHIHHRLLRLGLSPRRAVLILYAACFVFSAATLLLVHAQAGAAVFILVAIFAGAWLMLSRLGYHEIGEINITLRRGLLEQRGIIRQRVQLRRATETIGKAHDLSELWNSIQEVARIFDFDYAELDLPPEVRASKSLQQVSGNSGHSLTAYWKDGSEAASAAQPENYWKVELPYRCNCGSMGRVVFARALDKEELHLRLDPFVRLMSASISSSLARLQGKKG